MSALDSISIGKSGGYSDRQAPSSLLELALPQPCQSNVIVIAGTLGSGKTTVQNALAKSLAASRVQTHFIQNDAGRGTTDGDLLSEIPAQNLSVLSSGCVGCRDAAGLRDEIERLQKSGVLNIVVETSGMADLRKVQEALEGLSNNATVLLTINVKHFDLNHELGRLAGQVENASVVLLTWWQNSKNEEFDFSDPRAIEVLNYVAKSNPKALVCPIGLDGLPAVEAFHITGVESSVGIGDQSVRSQKPFVASVLPRVGVGAEDFVDALFRAANGNLIARAKGMVGGQVFQIVMDEVTFLDAQPNCRDVSWVNIVTFGGPIHEDQLSDLVSAASADEIKEKVLSTPRVAELVRDELSHAPRSAIRPDGKLQTDFDFDALHRLFMPDGKLLEGFPVDLVRRYFHSAIGLRWEAASRLLAGSFDDDPDKPRYMVRIGSMLSWYQSDHGSQLERFGIADQVIGLNPTLMMFEGLRAATDASHLHHFTDGWESWIKGRINFLRGLCGEQFNSLIHDSILHAAKVSQDNRYTQLAETIKV